MTREEFNRNHQPNVDYVMGFIKDETDRILLELKDELKEAKPNFGFSKNLLVTILYKCIRNIGAFDYDDPYTREYIRKNREIIRKANGGNHLSLNI